MNPNEPKPMDPERLDRARAVTSPCGHSWLRLLMSELLADRDYQKRRAEQAERERDESQAEVTRLRARVRVEAEDVERAGVTPTRCDAYMRAHGWDKTDDGGWGPAAWERAADLTKRPIKANVEILADVAFGPENYVAECIQGLAELAERPCLDILDEMAAMPLESGT